MARSYPRPAICVIGTKGKMLVEGDYWNTPRLIPQSKAKSFGTAPELLERSPGHHEEFFMACRGDKPRDVQPIELQLFGPDDCQYSAWQPRRTSRQETDSRPHRKNYQRSGRERACLA